MTVPLQKVIDIISGMSPAKREDVSRAIRARVSNAVKQEASNKIVESIRSAIEIGLTDREILDFVHQILRQRTIITNALIYRASAPSGLRDKAS